ncbi:MAG: magnesium transporter [Polyangiaceae bacterium]|nr:magnesium transporter [Polyangiaceae bacterium]
MRVGHLIGPELREILRESPGDARAVLDEFHPEDVADVVAELPEVQAAELLARLPAVDAATIFERLEDHEQEAIVEELGPESTAHIAAEMAPDDRADLLETLDQETSDAVLATLEKIDPEAAEEVAEIDRWPPASAGRLMTPAYVSVAPTGTVEDAVRAIRENHEAETANYVYLVNEKDRLVGVVSIRELLLGAPSAPLSEVSTANFISVPPTMDQEEVARRMAKYDLTALPVVGDRGVFLGIITVDDVIDVLTEEQSEDVQKLGAVEPLEAPYFATSFRTFIKKRASWLLALFVGEFFTGTALRSYDSILNAVTTLAFYVPLLVSTGGNSGGQSSSLVIRGMATGDIRLADWRRVLARELAQGVTLGLFLAAVGMLRVMLWGDGPRFAVVIGVTLIGIVMMGCTVGSMLPFLLKRMRFDPATSSAPFIASLVDVLGIVIYFNVARVVLADVIAKAAEAAPR